MLHPVFRYSTNFNFSRRPRKKSRKKIGGTFFPGKEQQSLCVCSAHFYTELSVTTSTTAQVCSLYCTHTCICDYTIRWCSVQQQLHRNRQFYIFSMPTVESRKKSLIYPASHSKWAISTFKNLPSFYCNPYNLIE